MEEKTVKKSLKKLILKKEQISVLTKHDQQNIEGGGFTTLGNCKTKFTCCNTPTSCNLSLGCY